MRLQHRFAPGMRPAVMGPRRGNLFLLPPDQRRSYL
ncbi:hypothetical protein SAMN04489712_104289 [Thermomonospora echinospora]|uniref:Uncharacterized protein n=1 Tax=Thermomonospora echinospora TaxID=1992 RepID=A0A1H5Z049_9ACTN|nr:hypothetical protein SAMN04489712_104289 [Thermomonospora echinospora]